MSRRSLLTFIFTVTLTGILSTTVLTPAIPDILAEFGRPAANAGYLVAVGTVAGIVVAPVAGFAADRFGRRVVLTVCLAVFGIFGGLSALAPTFEALLAARFVQGVGSAGLVNLAVVLIGDNWTGSERTLFVGRNTAILTGGLALIPPVSGWITELASWRAAFALYTLALVTAAAAWVILDDRRAEDRPDVSTQITDSLSVVRRPVIRVAILAGALAFVVIFGLFLTVLPVHLDEVFAMGAGQRGVIIAMPALIAMVASLNLGRLRRRFSARAMVSTAGLGFVAAFLLMGATSTLVLLVVATLLYGAAEGVLMPLLQDVVLADAPGEFRAVVMAVWVGFARIGQTVGPLASGLVLGWTSSGTTLAIGALAPALIFLLGAFGPFPGKRSQEQLAAG